MRSNNQPRRPKARKPSERKHNSPPKPISQEEIWQLLKNGEAARKYKALRIDLYDRYARGAKIEPGDLTLAADARLHKRLTVRPQIDDED